MEASRSRARLNIVVQIAEQRCDRIAKAAWSGKLIDDSLRGQVVERPGIFGNLRDAPEQSLEGSALRHRFAERVEGANLQARGVRENVPAERGGGVEDRACQLQRLQHMRRTLGDLLVAEVARALESQQDAVAHLRRGLAGEGDGQQQDLHTAINLPTACARKPDFLAGLDRLANGFQAQLLCLLHADVQSPACLNLQAHLVLESNPPLRLILYWKRVSIDWRTSAMQL